MADLPLPPPGLPVRSVMHEQTGGNRLHGGHTVARIDFRIAEIRHTISYDQVGQKRKVGLWSELGKSGQ